jgi:hypothetical protein
VAQIAGRVASDTFGIFIGGKCGALTSDTPSKFAKNRR